MLFELALPILVASVAVFFASFLSWMVLGLHKQDWRKIPREDDFLRGARECSIPLGNYMFPGCEHQSETQTEAFKAKWEAGPCGVMTIFPKVGMGRKLALMFLYFLVVNFCLAYLAMLAVKPGADFMTVFRFVSTAALLVYFAAIVPHAIWFHNRILGHLIDSIAFAVIVGAIFGAMWPGR